MVKRFLMLAGLSLALAGCQEGGDRSTRHLTPIPQATMALMAGKGMSKADPILVRAYKRESELEVWKRGSDGKYALLKTYPICRWSGQLGPKVREGDRQAPEGFYTVTPAQMNPNSAYYLSFDTGYPNAYDRALGHTGSSLMVHGTCSSRGCFAMTDEAISEVYAVARESFASGQRGFQFQSYPFRMTAENLAKHRLDPNIAFWKNLKEGADYFEVTKDEPKVGVCGKRYVFGGSDVAQGSCAPQVEPAVAERRERDDRKVAELVASGTPALKVVYEDGGQHESFRAALGPAQSDDGVFAVLNTRRRPDVGDVSRPEALAQGPREIPMEVASKEPGPNASLKASPKREAPSTTLAYARADAPASLKTVVASAKPAAKEQAGKAASLPAPQATAPVATPMPSTDAKPPLYKRMFGSLVGGATKPVEGPETAEASESAAAPAAAVKPVPKPRAKLSAGAVAKPDAAAADRRAETTPRPARPIQQAGLTATAPNP